MTDSFIDQFWATCERQMEELRDAATADDVIRILAEPLNPYGPGTSSAPAFWAGSGGDQNPYHVLRDRGWTVNWWEADYHWSLKAPDGTSDITYVEGDIYPNDGRPT